MPTILPFNLTTYALQLGSQVNRIMSSVSPIALDAADRVPVSDVLCSAAEIASIEPLPIG
jgi:hypothetical protein